ncbi:MAG: DEAD/DEAH box helicase family protein [Planctomycetales bacterium]|nr:DEAD/DEAH box helicase family protein [Planctomycetales bacterium]
MPTRSTPLFDIMNEEVDQPTQSVSPHAIQNHRTRASRKPTLNKRQAQSQQLLAFDDGTYGHRAQTASPESGSSNVHIETTDITRRNPLPGDGDTDREVESVTRKSSSEQTHQDDDGRATAKSTAQRDGSTSLIQALKFDAHPLFSPVVQEHERRQSNRADLTEVRKPIPLASGEKSKAREIIQAISVLQQLQQEQRRPTPDERAMLMRFGGFGAVARTLFPDPITGKYKDASWQELGQRLEALLSPADYESAKRTTFNAFYTSPLIVQAVHSAIKRLGVPNGATILEPGCGVGNFLSHDLRGAHYIGVEMDTTSGQIAHALYPQHDIRIENFRDTKLPDNSLDAVIGNVPFANIRLDHKGQRFALHDYFFAKSMDALKPGGVMALVTSHFTMDKQNASIREYLAQQADFVGAIRLPSDAFKQEGTRVVTDIIFLRKRAPGVEVEHVDSDWLATAPYSIDGKDVTVNRYFINHPEMVLGDWTLENQLYGDEGFNIKSNGDLQTQLQQALEHLPVYEPPQLASTSLPMPERFNRPPPVEHLTEGSLFVGDDQTIFQIMDGCSQAVTHGAKALTAQGTMMGKRLAALIGLRDAARLVLQAQNDQWPESQRHATRRSLNQLYDAFVKAYGPINKTTFSETKDGGVMRRMPNMVKFRDDPDAMLVLSLENYDEVTGKATKAPIFEQDVVGPKKDITHVDSAEAGLLASLDRTGKVDLAYIASVYGKPEDAIIAELGDLIFLNPHSHQYETADVYLSGNVREKLHVAEKAGPAFAYNADRLRDVQPPDLLPGDIDARLGSPWIPASDVEYFTAALLGAEPDAIEVGRLLKDATWSVDASYAAERSVKATSDFGTSRIDAIRLLELALNLKTPVIYDTIRGDNGDERVVNETETLAAREKQKLIQEKFKEWVFSDPERSERLVRIYNDTYNNLRPRLFDGSHLEFEGLNQAIALRQHQKDAIWRIISSGNTLLAHVVGAGKTFTMAAAGMKLKQAGLIKKPMYVVPNHMLEQFAREFMQLYPNAHLLVASKEDLTRDRRKFLTARIASNDWDGIIVTHSSFERIGMSKKYQQQFLKQQIDDYSKLLIETAAHGGSEKHRNLIKAIEKQKVNRENKLKDLSAEDKKDDGLVFDELGVDHIFVDEAHYFKNLETPTKMERVAGVQTGGSQRAFDIYMKSRYLSQLHPGHGVTFATGTPISNTMVELYNLQRFLDPEGLQQRGIEHFDGWAANFGEVVDTMEIAPDGSSLRPRSRFAKFNNLPELQQMFRSFADVQTASMLNLPRPMLKHSQPITISCPMSDDQCAIQTQLVERYERIRSQKIDPRDDNALAITTDGRKLALDGRMLTADASDEPESKINALVDNVARIWAESDASRGTQMIFCDMGVHPTPWGFSVYDDIMRKLVSRGIPADQIASIGEATSDAKKQALFERVRQGSVRVLLGSTAKMGTGTNVQKRLIALHHLDAPWKPAEVEQRDGRIFRQGNENPEVDIYRYVTQGSFDAYMWQALETKARFISQIMTGDVNQRSAEDIGGQELSYAEVKAIASGNPAVLTLAETDAELQRLAILRKNHHDAQFLARRKVRDLPDEIERLAKRLEQLKADEVTLMANHLSIVIDGQPVLKDQLQETIAKKLAYIPDEVMQARQFELGTFHGLKFGIQVTGYGTRDVYLQGSGFRCESLSREYAGPRAVLNAINRMVDTYALRIDDTRSALALAEQQLADYRERIDVPFAMDGYIEQLRELRDRLRLALTGEPQATSPDASVRSIKEIVLDIEQLRRSQQAHATVGSETTDRSIVPAESIVTQINSKLRSNQPPRHGGPRRWQDAVGVSTSQSNSHTNLADKQVQML